MQLVEIARGTRCHAEGFGDRLSERCTERCTDRCTERLALLRLHLEPGVTPAVARQLFEAFARPSDVLSSSARVLSRWLALPLAQALCRAPGASVKAAMQRTAQWAQRTGCQWLTWLDPDYPAVLRELTDAPVVLYAQGNLGVLEHPAVSIVGAREATAQARALAHQLALDLALAQWTVVSGLALGIDASAHRGALRAARQAVGKMAGQTAGKTGGALTVAVLGTAPDRCYPAVHHELAASIVEQGGLLLSEFALGTPTVAHHFPRRNRLVAALGRATVVVQARARSGSLITARLANELGRDVYAVPGRPGDPLSAGCHALIRQGAGLLEGVDDLWQGFGL